MAGVSRRGLLGGFFRKPVETLRAKIPDVVRAASAKRGPAPTPAPADAPRRTYPRRLRSPDDVVMARPDAAGRFVADLREKPLLPGGTWKVLASELAEPLVLVRVRPDHLACTTGECPSDQSDLRWHAGLEALWCPGCGSQWRLDGKLTRGPARRSLLSLHVAEADGLVRIDVP